MGREKERTGEKKKENKERNNQFCNFSCTLHVGMCSSCPQLRGLQCLVS